MNSSAFARFSIQNAVAALFVTIAAAPIASAQEAVDPKIAERIAKEKEDRRACKLELCKAFATPGPGAPIACDVTKTWLRDEILSRVVGGTYVWGYGHAQCSVSMKVDRGEISKMAGGADAKVAFSEHVATCTVDDKDQGKGPAFTVKLSVTPVATISKGEATSVSLEPVKTEGSGIATAAVSAILAVDKLSGLVSKAAASELNAFVYEKCKEDGIIVARK